MRNLSRIVWSEGMYLGPHHFQAQNRYFEDSFDFALSLLRRHSHGFTDCTLDADALRNGTVAVIHARGIFPDGSIFDISAGDGAPEPLAIRELFRPDADFLPLSLSIPARIPDGLNCSLNGAAPGQWTRYTAEKRAPADETTGKDHRTVTVGHANIRLLADAGSLPDVVSLPLARVIRSGSGHFVFDPSFVPPSLDITASAPLVTLVENLVAKLEQKSSDLALTRQANRPSPLAFSARDVARFWLLHAVNSGLAPLRHLLAKHAHPEELFMAMSRLAGALCTFALDSHPRALPSYDHQDPGACFLALDRHIRKHLDLLLPENCVIIPLAPAAKYFYEADLTDTRVFDRARWILSLAGSAPAADLLKAPQLVKVCSSQFVPELVKRALPGLPLVHLATPPSAVNPKVENEYFDIRKGGPCWDHLVKTRRVGVYVPGELPDPKLELLVVLDAPEGES
jgi:type VI secretion system protein ImpJ